MGKSNGKTDVVWSEHYAPHLTGTGFELVNARNPQRDRQFYMERMYVRMLSEMAMNRFEWKGLPDSVDIRYLEMNLFYQALSVFYFDTTVDKFLALQGAAAGPPNFAMNPTKFMITGNSTFASKTLKADQVVPIWANYMRMPETDIVMIYAGKLAELDRTIEINSKQARKTKILVANQNQRLSVRNVNQMIDAGESLVEVNADGYLGQGLDQAIQSIDLNGDPNAIEKLHILKTRLWGECMGYLGIDFANQDKKERLVADETHANDKQVSQMRRVSLNARQTAARQINEKWPEIALFNGGIPVSVDYYDSEDMSTDMGTRDGEDLEAGETDETGYTRYTQKQEA
jgi:hypothetical protein